MRARAPTGRGIQRAGAGYKYRPPLEANTYLFFIQNLVPKFDQHCTVCEWSAEILAAPHEHPICPSCGGDTERWYPIGGTRSVIGDEWVGGRWIENLDVQPVWVESKSHLKREMEKRGLVQKVRHVGVPGTDKSPHTTRWV